MKIMQVLENTKVWGKIARTQTLEIAIFLSFERIVSQLFLWTSHLVSYTVMLFGTFSVT